jgi:AAHS family 4-hydroxybenzoate transporter-like MFS transporter
VLTTCFAVGCINIALIGQPGLSLAMLFTVVFLAGFGVVGGQTAVNAMSATYYPTDLRATGIGAGLGIAIVAPVAASGGLSGYRAAMWISVAVTVAALFASIWVQGSAEQREEKI